jgi:site-specific DNA-methyltransferase (adenine-specific)
MFPEELPRRCIEMLSYKEDVVFDPFCGLGTTCLVAKRLERNYIGFEMSVEYCKKARSRITND